MKRAFLSMLLLILAACDSRNSGLPTHVGDSSEPVVGSDGKTYGKTHGFPDQWWPEIQDPKKPQWEILPQEAKAGEVILSKRTELGIFSNFAATPFEYRGKRYASIEGFWQATKYPESPTDERLSVPNIKWAFTRDQVEQLTGFDAKHAGDLANDNMKVLAIDWVTFETTKMIYRESGKSMFYNLIRGAMLAKYFQNREVCELLHKTGNLTLLPDHKTDTPTASKPNPEVLKAWQYHMIWMEIRDLHKVKTCS